MHWGDWDWSGGWGGWLAMTVGMVLFVAAVVAVIAWLVRQPADEHRPGADSILADRFARGEIDEDEYRRRRQTLRQG
jgi:putative membrane protein